MTETLNISTRTMRSFHLFGDLYEQAILDAKSDIAAFSPDRKSPDCIGAHWYGLRVQVDCGNSPHHFYLHTGLVFLPETKVGLMVELDKNKNPDFYDIVWDRVKSGELFNVNRDEPIYLKLFMPDDDFMALNNAGPEEQKKRLSSFFLSCANALCRAAAQDSFRLDEKDLLNHLSLTRAYRAAIDGAQSPQYNIEVNDKDPDNFGQYAAGFRYWLKDAQSDHRFYAYFGGIYSYKKDPAGVFAEIDWLNNQELFQKVFDKIQSGELFTFSRAEPKFVKLFMSPALIHRFNASNGSAQRELLKDFLVACNTAIIQAAR